MCDPLTIAMDRLDQACCQHASGVWAQDQRLCHSAFCTHSHDLDRERVKRGR